MKCAVDMGSAPVHYLAEFLPVFHFFKWHRFNRCSGYDHAVKILILYAVKGLVKCQHVFFRRVFRGSANCKKFNFYLQRSVPQQSGKLGFGGYLSRHQIQYQDPQRTDVLSRRPVFVHDEYVFAFKCFSCRKLVVYLDWHAFTFLFQFYLYKAATAESWILRLCSKIYLGCAKVLATGDLSR